MRIWTNDIVYEHPWETVVQAVWRKYPNPYNPAVVGLDVVDRSVDKKGVLKSHRLMQTKWGFPSWARPILGDAKVCYGCEHSEVDPKKKVFSVRTRNLTFGNVISIEETLTYKPHPEDQKKTFFEQENVVTVHGVPLGSYLENVVVDGIKSNAHKGKAAMESVIEKINLEKEEVLKNVESMINTTKKTL